MTSPRTPAFVTRPYSDDDHRRKQSQKAGALAKLKGSMQAARQLFKLKEISRALR
jgi:hypothetical protein